VIRALDRLPLEVWLAFWRVKQRYHRYTVEGLDRLCGSRAALIVGYHGRPFAYDMCMLTVALYDRLGYLPHGVIHRGVDAIPPLKWFCDGLGFVTGDGEAIEAAVARGEHIVVTPGGAREGCRAVWQRYRVCWEERVGYLRLAKRYGLPIVPVATDGADGTYLGLNDAYVLGRALGFPRDWAWIPWLAVGPLGVFPFSPPFPVRMRQLIGAPIEPDADGAGDLLHLHHHVAERVQALLDEARNGAAR
jgi:1-acyl-sn-glycerol-3-phosphate acyltransferase